MCDSSEARTSSPRDATTILATTDSPADASPVSQPPPAGIDEHTELEVDNQGTDGEDGSTIDDDQLSSYTSSLASSAVDYPVEYGRRYHAFRPGSYILPNDEYEMDRMDFAHAMIVKAIGSRLYRAPLQKDKINRILDIGTGTGIWSMEMGDIFPNAEVIGNDLSAIQPEWVPPNVKFIIDDVESPWIDDKKYDFIFCRCMAACITDWPRLVKNVYENLNPGGWAEFQDANFEYYSDDGTLTEEHAFKQWSNTLNRGLESIGREPSPGPKLNGWVKDAGFHAISHTKIRVPLAPWAKDQFYWELGAMNLRQLLDGLEGFTMRLFCGVLGQTQEEAQVLLALVRKELKTLHSFHSQLDFHVVYGQKPEDITG